MSDSKEDAFLKELRATFTLEAQEHLQALAAGLIELENNAGAERQQALIETIFREVHSLKGAARAVERRAIETLCQALENVLSALKQRRIEFLLGLADLLHSATDALTQLLAADASDVPTKALLALCASLDNAALGTPTQLQPTIRRAAEVEVEALKPTTPLPPVLSSPAPSLPIAPVEEHSAALDTVRIAVAKLDSLLRRAEGLLAAKLNAEQRVLDIQELAATVATLRKERSYGAAVTLQSVSSTVLARQPEKLFATQTALMQTLDTQLNALTSAAQSDWQALAGRVDQLLEEIKKISMLPATSALKIFPKLVRDLARASAKEATLNFSGGDIEVDRRILEEMRDPLIHLMRNCIDHGIEKPAERQRLGKPTQGSITLTIAQRDGGRIEIMVGDDGAGIDIERVRDAAQRLELHSGKENAHSDADALMALIFQSGVSTSPLITDISGRGLGLAIVREKIEKLGGTINVHSELGSGTQFRIELPITLATYRGVQVRCGERRFVFPTTQVEQVATIRRAAIKTIENRAAITLQGRVVAVVYLADLLGLPEHAASGDTVSIVIGRAAEKHIAFVVDEIVDEQEVLVKSLGEQLLRVRNIAGAARLKNGMVALILNIADLIKAAIKDAGRANATRVPQAMNNARKSILVAEDSITSRMLLKGILESVGYQVTVAVDGEDALQRLRAQPFDLVVSDVDMPRMNGLELTASIRAEAAWGSLPVVLVTTLASAADRERGAEVGANAYVVKSSFEQSNLLEIVRRLL